MLFVCEIEKDSDKLVNAEHHFGATGNRLQMKLYTTTNTNFQYYKIKQNKTQSTCFYVENKFNVMYFR